jgi:hypothetical protein
MKRMGLSPAYGREYKSKQTIVDDLLADKDFLITDFNRNENGRLINLSQIRDLGVTSLSVRYSKLTRVVVLLMDELKTPKEKLIDKTEKKVAP